MSDQPIAAREQPQEAQPQRERIREAVDFLQAHYPGAMADDLIDAHVEIERLQVENADRQRQVQAVTQEMEPHTLYGDLAPTIQRWIDQLLGSPDPQQETKG